MGVPLYVICYFSFVAFNVLSLIFVSLITMCLSVFLFGFILSGTLCTSWTWLTISFPMLGKFSAKYFLRSLLSLSSPSGTPMMRMLVHLMLSQESLRPSSFFFLSLFYILFCGSDFHHSVLQVTYLFFCLSYSAVDSFQCIIHLLVNIFCIISILFLRS